MNELVIIIVSYNTREYLDACLRSLQTARIQCLPQIVVVDNGSSDGSVDLVRTSWPAVRLIELGENLGYAAANNRAIRATTSDLILLLNSDTVVPAGAVDGLVQLMHTEPEVSAIGPRLIDADGHVELSFGSMITPWSETWQKFKGATLARRTPGLASWVARATARRHYPDWVSGACLLVRRADAKTVGLFDERFFLYAEDVDLCASIRGLGRRVMFTPVVKVVHHGGRSGVSDRFGTRAAYRRSQLAFYEKHHPAWVPMLRLYLRAKGALPGPLV